MAGSGGSDAARLEANLTALRAADPALAARLRLPCRSDHLLADGDGRVVVRHHRAHLPLAAPATAARRVLGVGLGEAVTAGLAASPEAEVVAWERDPALLRLALARNDWAAALAAGRLSLLLGADVRGLGVAEEVTPHPLLGELYADERDLLARPEAPVALLVTGGLFVDSLSRALRELGHAVYRVDVTGTAAEETAHAVDALAPRLLAGVNYVDGLAEFCAARGLPGFCWEIDPSTSALASPESDKGHFGVYTWRADHVEVYRRAGFHRVAHVPLAADLAVRTPPALDAAERARYGAEASFVGASMLANARRCRAELLAQWERHGDGPCPLDDVLAAQRADLDTYRVPELLAEACPEFLAAAAGERQQPAALAAEIAASERRLTCVANLGRQGFAVWGDEGWETVTRHGVDHRGPVGHARELNRVYAGTLVNVDLGRLYQLDIVTMRVFDCLACGGFVLAEQCEDLAELFDVGREVVDHAGLADLVQQVAHYRARPDEARAIAARGRAAVLERHDLAARVARMVRETLGDA